MKADKPPHPRYHDRTSSPGGSKFYMHLLPFLKAADPYEIHCFKVITTKLLK